MTLDSGSLQLLDGFCNICLFILAWVYGGGGSESGICLLVRSHGMCLAQNKCMLSVLRIRGRTVVRGVLISVVWYREQSPSKLASPTSRIPPQKGKAFLIRITYESYCCTWKTRCQSLVINSNFNVSPL